ncbi:hypothetical protein [Pinibacter soli]|uniref:Gliding motility protein GldL n=1 Tax=Pinibacter soli TaxID=3044211 RepID=A0ABT6RC82_9BACT|nr:hypothetical protein [Pinibacter soli]MDI3320010.1 hypothetical protein [Pinibacter soli]
MKKLSQIKIGKWPLYNYLKVAGMFGGLIIGGIGWHLTDEFSDWYNIMAFGGLLMFIGSIFWAAQKPGNAPGNSDR